MNSIELLFDEIAFLNEALINMAIDLQKRPGIAEVHRGFDVRKYTTGVMIEIFLEAEMKDSIAYCWWLDLKRNEKSWRIDLSLLKNEDGGQHIQAQLVDCEIKITENLIFEFQRARKILLTSIETFPFSRQDGNQWH